MMDLQSETHSSSDTLSSTAHEYQMPDNSQLGLPIEMLMEVLKWSTYAEAECIPSLNSEYSVYGLSRLDGRVAPLKLCFVCKLWKKIVRDMPDLWSGFMIALPPGPKPNMLDILRRTRMWLRLSKSRPLRVAVYLSDENNLSYEEEGGIYDQMEIALLERVRRLRELYLLLPDQDMSSLAGRLLGMVQLTGHNLETLVVKLSTVRNFRAQLHLSRKPRLRKICLPYCSNEWWPTFTSIPSKKLECIAPVSTNGFYHALTAFPSLESIEIYPIDDETIPGNIEPYIHLHVSCLYLHQSIDISEHTNPAPGEVLNNICLPSIEKLVLAYPASSGSFFASLLGFLKRSSAHPSLPQNSYSNLRFLTVHDPGLRWLPLGDQEMVAFVDVLRWSPRCDTLRIGFPISVETVRALTLDQVDVDESNTTIGGSSAYRNLCPELEYLSLGYDPAMFAFSELAMMLHSRLGRDSEPFYTLVDVTIFLCNSPAYPSHVEELTAQLFDYHSICEAANDGVKIKFRDMDCSPVE